MRRIDPARCAFFAAALVPLVLVTGCAESGGVRVEGTAATSAVNTSPPPPKATGVDKIDPVTLLRKDPKVGAEIKSDLKPCGGDEYPIDTSYGNLTGNSVPDVVINVSSCGDGVGLGSYVYRMENGRYTDVFGDEQPPVYIDIDKSDLELTRQVYSPGDSVCCPSGEDVITYHWSGDRFTETSRTHSDYGNKANG
ncbi:LppP/LprE family lipoprotein [Streptomyces sp. PTM05]|uniref:LppP/LprE family lipoprotein n=1 Tax=Streptantibioticus parmotrematis TaxID=2873249 RepID=A0ABS7QZT6_9ACTN|nr:LppP/LprE family lipoprotein [Streptantibioticus parmotrematis]MBY8888715.1 LppP/LprE family lipoprotein [Streptantibioticus parmotrematis]